MAGKVADPTDLAVQALIEDMLVTVADADGVGIAAPQVFQPLVHKAIFKFDLSPRDAEFLIGFYSKRSCCGSGCSL